MTTTSRTGPSEIDCLLRELAPRVVGVLARRSGDFDAAEDAVQEALLAASLQWSRTGLPDNPRAWLIRVAQRRLTDTIRTEIARRTRESMVAGQVAHPGLHDDDGGAGGDRDDTLALFFLCCHPELPAASAIALTLRAVGGLTTGDIARSFMVPETTMAQRISRAKKQLSGLDRPFAPPPETGPAPGESMDVAEILRDSTPDWGARLDPVLRVLYVMFTEGHTSSAGSRLDRTDLAAEAIRLTRLIQRLLPADPEVTALLAIMLLTDARRPARTGPNGELIPLAEQDRARWDRTRMLEGIRYATRAVGHGLTGPYRIQAAIAAVHTQARRAEDTDWVRILDLYERLERLAPNPMVTLNRAVATAMVHGPAAGLALTESLDTALPGHHRLHAVRGHLHEMAGARTEAIECYLAAARATTSTPEHDYLTLRAARLRTTYPPAERGDAVPYLTDPRVDHYIDGLPDWQQNICRQVRDLVHAADPEVTETIKRTVQPYFVLQGNICALLAARDHVNVFLYDGGIVPDPAGIITGGHDNTTGRTIAVYRDDVLDAAAVTEMFRAIIANNRAGGWRKLKRES